MYNKTRMTSLILILILIVALTLGLLTGCMPGNEKYVEEKPANFLSGIWHGWIAPLSLIVSIWSDNIRLYEVNNTGFWYDFGFYVAVISGFGGLSLTRNKNKKDKS